jgi:type II secretory pathway pseudopilin PulG
MEALRRVDGFSLPELLTATLIMSLAVTGLVSFAATQSRAFARAEMRITASQDVRLALEVMSRDLRLAGFDAIGRAVEPLPVAGATQVTLQQDGDEDGTVDAASDELITYVFRPIDGTLSRIVGRQSMPLLSGLPADGVRLHYADAHGMPLGRGGAALDDGERRAVHRIDIALLVRDSHGEPLGGAVTRVVLRNRPWEP